MEKPLKDSTGPSRRQFLLSGLTGTSVFGLGGLLGRLTPGTQAASAQAGTRSGLGKEFTYDLDKLQKTDPKLIHYETTGQWDSGLKEISCLTIGPGDRLHAAGNKAILSFTTAGARQGEIQLEEAPRCIAVAADGTLYAGMSNHLEVFNPQGKRQAVWPSLGGKAVVTSIAAGEKELFVADAGNRVVYHLDLSGKILNRIGVKDPAKNIPGLIIPSPYCDVEIGKEGLLWVANTGRHQLEAYTFDGALEAFWGEATMGLKGFCGCCNPAHFTRLPDGRFVTSEKGLTRIKVYSEKGEFESVVAGPEQFPMIQGNSIAKTMVVDVAADSQGRIFIGGDSGGRVRMFTRIKAA